MNTLFLGPYIKCHLDSLEGELGQWLDGDQFCGADIQVIMFACDSIY
jgi:glutathione S-transferase